MTDEIPFDERSDIPHNLSDITAKDRVSTNYESVYGLDDIDLNAYDVDLGEDLGVDEEPEIIVLCGSTRFKEAYRIENMRFSLQGKIVLSVGFFGHADNINLSESEKRKVDALHKRKIELADRIHVINVDGYVGDSTRSEIAYAKSLGKEVTFLEEQL